MAKNDIKVEQIMPLFYSLSRQKNFNLSGFITSAQLHEHENWSSEDRIIENKKNHTFLDADYSQSDLLTNKLFQKQKEKSKQQKANSHKCSF